MLVSASLNHYDALTIRLTSHSEVVSVMNPILASLCETPQEMGFVRFIFSKKTAWEGLLTLFSARMGFALLFTGLAGLIGPPINGALLTSEYKWWRPIVFSGVR